MNSQVNSPLTDSPWFWALAFSFMGLLALAAVGFSGKYQKRQTQSKQAYLALIVRNHGICGGAITVALARVAVSPS